MSGRRVNFRDSPPGGSSSRYTSDSGVGSLSDHAGRPPNPFTAQNGSSQWTDLATLQEAYRSVHASKDQWKKKAKELDEDASQSRKNLKEVEAKWRAIVDRNDQLEDEKKKMFREKKALAEQVDAQRGEMQELRRQLADADAAIQQLQRGSPPVMSGANPEPKPHRSSSKKENPKEEKKRLSKRFESKDSDGSKSDGASSSKASRPRRQSYVEPFGPGPRATAVPPPEPSKAVRAQYPAFTQSSHRSPTYATTQQPLYSDIPRSAHPHVSLVTDDPGYFEEQGYTEDGAYYAYPLPRDPAKVHRSKHSR